MTEQQPLATHDYASGSSQEALEFLKRTRSELRMLRFVRVWPGRFRLYDINGDCFEIDGLGFEHADIVHVLDHVNTAYKRELIHEPTKREYKEFKTGRRRPWAQDRVM